AQRLAPRVFHSCSLLSPPSPATCLRSLHDALPIFDFNASGPALPIAAVYTAGGALVLLGRHLLQREGSTLWSPTTQVLLGCLALAGAWILDFALWQDAGIDPEASAQGALIMAFLSLEGFLVGVAVLMGAYLALRTSRNMIERPRSVTFDVTMLFL